MKCSEVIGKSAVAFGTSGTRGLVSDFTSLLCMAYSQAFLHCMQRNYPLSTVCIGMDNRPSSEAIATACADAANQLGLKVIFYGVLPTPALALAAMAEQSPAIMITGSHIPFDRNGIKFYRPDGEISKQDEQAITACDQPVLEPDNGYALPPVTDSASATYMHRYTSLYPQDVLAGKIIGIYEHSSAGRDLYKVVFEAMGAAVVSLERSDQFVPIDTEAVSVEDQVRARNWSQTYQFDAIFSTDGDGDRPLIADEKGRWLRGDIVGLLCARYLNTEALAVPVSCNTAIEGCGEFKQVVRTRIGSPYVIAEFDSLSQNYASVAGFEANGGFLLGSDVSYSGSTLSALPTRDALLPGVVLMAEAAIRGKALSELVAELPQRYTASDRLKNISSDSSNAMLANAAEDSGGFLAGLGLRNIAITAIDQTDGLRLTLATGDIIHLRPSGNAPELRCYSEADSQEKAEALVEQVLKGIAELQRL